MIFKEEPALVGPRLDPNAAEMCCGCFGKLGKVSYQCPKCNLARICSEKCAEAKFHSFECEILANSKIEENVQVELQTPLRFLGMKEKDPKKYIQLKSLLANKEIKKNGPDWERISKMSTDIYNKFKIKDVSIEEIEDVICILESNSYQVISSQDSLNGVYVQASMLNHTCFKGPKI